MKIIVISLIDANQRRAQIQAQLSAHNLPFTWLDAVDGRKWSDDELSQFIDKKALYKNLSHKPIAGSVGCHLSHMKAYETLLASDDEAMLILEDDAIIDAELPHYISALAETMSSIDILFLCDRRENRPAIEIGKIGKHKKQVSICVKRFSNIGTTGYIINRRAARYLLDNHKDFGIEIDCLLNRWWHHGLAVATIKPDLVKDEDAVTQIGYALEPLKRTLYQKTVKAIYDLKESYSKRKGFHHYCQSLSQSLKQIT